MSSVANRVIKNSAWLYAKMAIILFVSLLTTRLLLNSLGAADFGIYSVVGGAISMLGFISGAMTSATQRFMSYYEGEQDLHKQRQIFNVSIVIHLLLGAFIVVVLLAGGVVFFSHVFNIDPTRVTAAKMVYLCVIASTFLTVINTPYEAVMTAHENMRYYALMGIVESLLKLAVAYAVVYTSSDKLVVYGLPLAATVKRMGRQSIHLGGGTQLLFGVKGQRWLQKPYLNIFHYRPDVDIDVNYQRLFNEYWVFPSTQERPANFQHVEQGCYW